MDTRLRHRVNAVYTFHVPSFARRMAHSQLYINGGGSLMQDVTSRRSLWFYLYTLDAAKRRGCKVMMYGCGIGLSTMHITANGPAVPINRSVDVITRGTALPWMSSTAWEFPIPESLWLPIPR